MDADIVDLKTLVDICQWTKTVLFLDDCHGAGVIGKTGRGTPEYCGVPINQIDAYCSTMAKGLSGGGGGYIVGSSALAIWLKQRSRTYIFSNAICPPIVNCAWRSVQILKDNPEWIQKRDKNAAYFRKLMRANGFTIKGNDDCPICPVWMTDE